MNLFRFPTGEAHCRMEEKGEDRLFVPMQPNLNDWLMSVLLACDANHRVRNGKPFDLFLPYLPYSRQDRPTGGGEPFSLKVVGAMLNAAPCAAILTLDVHSDVAFACVDRLVNIPQTHFISLAVPDPGALTLVIPDQGAFKKSHALASGFGNVATALKHRDTGTGHLSVEGLFGDVKNRDCLIVDDICDGGMTFILLSRYLHAQGAASVSLAVTHGVFTKGTDPLFEAGIRAVFTTDSFPQAAREGLFVTRAETVLTRFLQGDHP